MKRFFHKDNTLLKDYSTQLENYHANSAVIDYVLTEDALYVGAELPFNSLFFDVKTANDQAANITIQYWDGSAWRDTVETIDESNKLFNSGHITWTTSKSYNWAKDDTERVTDLTSITVYDLYWLKITFSATLNPLTELNWIGSKFCDTNDLAGEYSLFSKTNFISAYETGKTDWGKEIVLASRLLIEDLIDRNAIQSGEQLLERRKLKDVCVSKTAEIIFKNLGDDYDDDRKKAKQEYESRLNKKNFSVDLNQNARLDTREKGMVTGGLFR